MLQPPPCPSLSSSEALDYLMLDNFLGGFSHLIGKAAVIGSRNCNAFGTAGAIVLSRDINLTIDLRHDVPPSNDPTAPPNAGVGIALQWGTHG